MQTPVIICVVLFALVNMNVMARRAAAAGGEVSERNERNQGFGAYADDFHEDVNDGDEHNVGRRRANSDVTEGVRGHADEYADADYFSADEDEEQEESYDHWEMEDEQNDYAHREMYDHQDAAGYRNEFTRNDFVEEGDDEDVREYDNRYWNSDSDYEHDDEYFHSDEEYDEYDARGYESYRGGFESDGFEEYRDGGRGDWNRGGRGDEWFGGDEEYFGGRGGRDDEWFGGDEEYYSRRGGDDFDWGFGDEGEYHNFDRRIGGDGRGPRSHVYRRK